MKKLIFDWTPVVVWCGLIFYLSGIPDLRSDLPGRWDLIARKAAHMFEYGILAWLFYRAAQGSWNVSPRLAYWMTFAYCFIYAMGDEYHQSFVPGRYPSFLDVIIDAAGSMISLEIVRARIRGGRTV
ncbi:MAG TPA: VanZ family protein [Elusimicrobiota bacterium]|nr:VanZ family protein [Elusimicrobiota bacterium]